MVNYPHKLKAKSSINRPVPSMINFANRGMSLKIVDIFNVDLDDLMNTDLSDGPKVTL